MASHCGLVAAGWVSCPGMTRNWLAGATRTSSSLPRFHHTVVIGAATSTKGTTMLSKTTTLSLSAVAIGSALTFGALHNPAVSSPAARKAVPTVEVMLVDIPWTGGHDGYLDAGKKGLGPGDQFFLTDLPVYEHGTSHRIGSLDAVELILSARHDGTVTEDSTYRFPGGTVNTHCILRHTDDPNRCAVSGGTGDYLGVSGQITYVRENSKRKVNVMRLELVR